MKHLPTPFEGQYDLLLREVLESIDDAVIVFDQDKKIAYVNEGACEMFKKQESELIGLEIASLPPVDKRNRFEKLIKKLGRSAHHSIELRGDDEFIGLGGGGHSFYAEGKLAKLHDNLSYILVLRDVTWKMALESELQSVIFHLKEVGVKAKERLEHPRIMDEFPSDEIK